MKIYVGTNVLPPELSDQVLLYACEVFRQMPPLFFNSHELGVRGVQLGVRGVIINWYYSTIPMNIFSYVFSYPTQISTG